MYSLISFHFLFIYLFTIYIYVYLISRGTRARWLCVHNKLRNMSFWTLSKVRVSVLYDPDGTRADKMDKGQTVLCLIKHILLSQFQHTLNYSLKWIPRSFLALSLNNRPWSMLHVLSNEDREKCNTRTTMWVENVQVSVKKLEGVIQREENKIHFKLNTIKSAKACDAFLSITKSSA